MGYRVTKDGEIICDTAEEAIALARAMARGEHWPEHKRVNHVDESGSRWTESRYREFMSNIKGRHQRAFLDLLLANPHGKTDKAIRQALSLESNNALAGVTAGLSKNAEKVGIDVRQLFTKERLLVGNERVLEYTLADSFRSIAQATKREK